MPFFERNSFVLRQLLQPGWVNRTNLSFTISIVESPCHGAKLRGTYQPQWRVSTQDPSFILPCEAVSHAGEDKRRGVTYVL
jgi:hypothetical protein